MKCRFLKKFSFTPLSAALLVLLCSCLSLLSFGSSPASAVSSVSASGTLRSFWVGFASPGVSSYDSYLFSTGWLSTDDFHKIAAPDVNGVQGAYATPTNLSYCADLPIHNSWLNYSLAITVPVNFQFRVSTTAGTDFISLFEKQPFITGDFIQASVEQHLPSGSSYWPSYADSVTVRDFKHVTTSIDGSFAYFQYSATLVLSLPEGLPSDEVTKLGDTYLYSFCYRANGNKNTNNQGSFGWFDDGLSFYSADKTGYYAQVNMPSLSMNYSIELGDLSLPPSMSDKLDAITGAINGTTDAIDKNTEAVDKNTDAIKDQTDQIVGAIKDGQQAEKDEQDQREEQGKDDAEKAQNVFRLDLFNPFAPIFEMFNPGGCVSIPTLASWLHVDNPQVCPWFPDSVRSVLTPVISIASIMLLFGFVVKWLRSGDGFVI